MAHIPVLLVLVPLLTALALPAVNWMMPRLTQIFLKSALLFNLALAVLAMRHVVTEGPWHYWLGNWAPPFGIEFVVDAMSGTVVLVTAGMAFVIALYARPFFKMDEAGLQARTLFYVLFTLMVTGVIGVAVAGDIFTLYVFIEIASISSYGLVAMGGRRAAFAAFRYLILGTVAATFYLLGTGLIFAMTGTLNMAQLSTLLPPMMGSPAILAALCFVMLGLGTKTAMVPLHAWLPDAHTYGPTPAIAFLATALLKAFAYGIYRFLYQVFGGHGQPVTAMALQILGWLAAAGILYGSVMAIAQKDFRRMLAYSTIAQISYIPLGIAIGTPAALAGAALQMISHSMSKGCLFMIKSGMHLKLHTTQISELRGMSVVMPFSSLALTISAFSMIGLPPTSGFFVKWQLVRGAAEAGFGWMMAVLVLSGLLNAVYFFRILENVFIRKPEPDVHSDQSHGPMTSAGPELPLPMLAAMMILAAGILAAGVGSGWLTEHIFSLISLAGGGL